MAYPLNVSLSVPLQVSVDLRKPDPLMGMAAISNARNLQTSVSPGGIAGVGTGFCVYGIARPTGNLANLNAYLMRTNHTTQGWAVNQSGSSNLVFRCADGGGTLVLSAAYALAASLNKILGYVGVHTGSALLLYINRAAVGAPVAITGFTANSNRTFAGAVGSASAYCDWYGAGGAHAVPTAQNVLDWFDLVKAKQRLVAMPGISSSHLWIPPQLTIGDVPDSIGTDTMTRQGTGHALVSDASPEWGW